MAIYGNLVGGGGNKRIVADGNFLVGNGTQNMEEMTPDEVLSHINGASVTTMTTAEYEALEATNANTLYVLTDAEEEVVPKIQIITWGADD